MSRKQLVHIVDDDPAIRASTAGFLMLSGFSVETYSSAEDFLNSTGSQLTGCVVTDVRMPGMTGIELMSKIRERGLSTPVIAITAYSDASVGLEAMKQGAIAVLEKPFSHSALVKVIRGAFEKRNSGKEISVGTETVQESIASLNTKEKEVLVRLLKGESNKLVAENLGVSPRTFENYRANIMWKLKVNSLAELFGLAPSVEIAE